MRSSILLGITVGSLGAFSVPSAAGAPSSEPVVVEYVTRLHASQPHNDMHLGRGVAVSGDCVAVARASALAGINVYRREGAQWSLEAELAPGGSHHSTVSFGDALWMDAERIFVGDRDEDQVGTNAGAVFHFRLDVPSGTWVEEPALYPAPGALQRFGYSIDVEAELLLVGGIGSPPGSTVATGTAYLFEQQASGGWTTVAALHELVTLSDDDFFGAQVAIEGDWIAVSAPGSDDAGNGSGVVHIFRREAQGWVRHQKLIGTSGYTTGWTLGLDQGTLVVGSFQAETGGMHVFELSGDEWLETAFIPPPGGGGDPYFGSTVALSGDLLVVGVPTADELGPDSGRAHLYRRDGAEWLHEQVFVSPQENPAAVHFGASVAIDPAAGWVVAGEPRRGLFETGSACVFRLSDAFTSICSGDGSGTPCPCANPAPGAGGCANSSDVGAHLGAGGSHHVADDDLLLQAEDLIPNQPALAIAGTAASHGGAGVPFGDGLRCAVNAVVRLGVRVPGSSGSTQWGPGLAGLGGWQVGDTRVFQVWYRDPAGPCDSGFNLSDGLLVRFTE